MANRVLDPLGADEHPPVPQPSTLGHAGAPGLVPRVPDPLRALVAPPNASGAPVVAHWVLGPQGTGRHRLCAAGAPGLALWVPHPLRALTLSRNSSGAGLRAHWESDLPADPPCGVTRSPRRPLFLLCEMAVQGYTGSGWGDHGWVGGDLSAPGSGWVAGVVPPPPQ